MHNEAHPPLTLSGVCNMEGVAVVAIGKRTCMCAELLKHKDMPPMSSAEVAQKRLSCPLTYESHIPRQDAQNIPAIIDPLN